MASGQPVALVSGSGGGIGTAVVQTLQRDGFLVAGLDLDGAGGDAAVEVSADVTRYEECEAAVAQLLAKTSRIDALVNCAGTNLRAPLVDVDLDSARQLFDINVWGSVHLTRACYQALSRSPQASVVTITSINGELGIEGGSIYGMSKAALTAMVRTLAVEWAPVPIRVNAVAPAIVPSAMNAEVRGRPGYLARKLERIPLRRVIEPHEVAEAVAFLAGPRSSAITGDTIFVDGGAVIQG